LTDYLDTSMCHSRNFGLK